jgi:hypothetical protein
VPTLTDAPVRQRSDRLHDAWRELSSAPGPIGSVLCWAGAALLVLSALIHLHLWDTGYRHIPTIGPLFLVQGVAGLVVAVVVAVTRRPIAALAGAVFAAGTILGLVLSVEVGLFGFRDSFGAPYATSSLVLESVAVVVLVAAALFGIHASLGERAGRPVDVARA